MGKAPCSCWQQGRQGLTLGKTGREDESGKKVIGLSNLASARLSPFPYLFPWALPNFDNTHCLGQEQALGVCTAMARGCRYNPCPPYGMECAVKMYQRAWVPQGEKHGSHLPIISMKICFQCSQVWKPCRRAEPSGKRWSCCCRNVSHFR